MPRPGYVGALLLHGKWDRPEGALAPLGAALGSAGVRVITPPCPWTPRRLYDRGFEAALDEIAEGVATLRALGCARVVVGGHSLGANAALAHAAWRGTADALLMIAPAHHPERLAAEGHTTAALALAREAPPGARLRLPDINQGMRRLLRFEAAVWLSYFDPQGRAVMSRSAAALGVAHPVLWLTERGAAGAAFDLLPAHAENARLDLDCSHFEAPAAGSAAIVDWITRLDQGAWNR